MRIHLLVLACAVALPACDVRVNDKGLSVDLTQGRASDEWTRSYTLPKGGRVEVINTDGVIEAFPAAGAEVEVRAVRDVRAASDEAAQEILKALVIREDVSAGVVSLETTGVPESRGFRQSVTVEYRVNVPPGLDVTLKTESGGVRMENIDGRLTASSTNGGVTGRGLSGALVASTVNGGINVEFASVTGDVRLTTVNGGIVVAVPRTIAARLEASAVNGGVLVEDAFPLEASERSRQRVTGLVNGGGPALEVRTTNGGIRINAAGSSASARDGSR